MVLTGHCNCKAITVTIQDRPADAQPHYSIYCQCITCKRQSGGFGTAFVIADDEQVKIDDPQNLQKTWVDDLTDSGVKMNRQFCGRCGSPITSISPNYAGKTIVKLGLLDDPPKAAVGIYCKNQADWMPKFDEKAGVMEVPAAPPS